MISRDLLPHPTSCQALTTTNEPMSTLRTVCHVFSLSLWTNLTNPTIFPVLAPSLMGNRRLGCDSATTQTQIQTHPHPPKESPLWNTNMSKSIFGDPHGGLRKAPSQAEVDHPPHLPSENDTRTHPAPPLPSPVSLPSFLLSKSLIKLEHHPVVHTRENDARIARLSAREQSIVLTDGGNSVEAQLRVLTAIEAFPPDEKNQRVWTEAMVPSPSGKDTIEYRCRAAGCRHRDRKFQKARQHFVSTHVAEPCWGCPVEGCPYTGKYKRLDDLKHHHVNPAHGVEYTRPKQQQSDLSGSAASSTSFGGQASQQLTNGPGEAASSSIAPFPIAPPSSSTSLHIPGPSTAAADVGVGAGATVGMEASVGMNHLQAPATLRLSPHVDRGASQRARGARKRISEGPSRVAQQRHSQRNTRVLAPAADQSGSLAVDNNHPRASAPVLNGSFYHGSTPPTQVARDPLLSPQVQVNMYSTSTLTSSWPDSIHSPANLSPNSILDAALATSFYSPSGDDLPYLAATSSHTTPLTGNSPNGDLVLSPAYGEPPALMPGAFQQQPYRPISVPFSPSPLMPPPEIILPTPPPSTFLPQREAGFTPREAFASQRQGGNLPFDAGAGLTPFGALSGPQQQILWEQRRSPVGTRQEYAPFCPQHAQWEQRGSPGGMQAYARPQASSLLPSSTSTPMPMALSRSPSSSRPGGPLAFEPTTGSGNERASLVSYRPPHPASQLYMGGAATGNFASFFAPSHGTAIVAQQQQQQQRQAAAIAAMQGGLFEGRGAPYDFSTNRTYQKASFDDTPLVNSNNRTLSPSSPLPLNAGPMTSPYSLFSTVNGW